MPVIAIVNRKGGSGKSTLATHVAAWLAHRGETVMLGDVDRQHSCTQWLARRRQLAPDAPALTGWAIDPQRVLRPPTGTSHVVLDTPGGLQGYELARLLGHADLVLMPVCDAAFDLEAATEGLAELKAHPRVAAGRVRVAAVGLRAEARGRSLRRLRAWADAQGVAWLGAIPPSLVYPHCAGQGLTVFDLPPNRHAAQRAAWAPVTEGLDRLLLQATTTRARGHRPLGAPAPRLAPGLGMGLPGRSGGSASGTGTGWPGADAPAVPVGAMRPAARAPRPRLPMGGWLRWLGALWSPADRQAWHR